MNNKYLNLTNQENIIEGVVLQKLTVHKDESGLLFETLRKDWGNVYNNDSRAFAMQYMSQTPSGLVRDADKWHFHNFQEDRFICVSGRIVTAILDTRKDSKTFNNLNLFLMGPQTEEEMYMIIIPKQTCHGFMVISKETGYLLNFPTQLYNKEDEVRKENNSFDWATVKKDFGL